MNLDATHSFIGTSFSWTWSNSLAAAVLIVLAFASQFVFRKLLAARWLYALWLCVLLRLMMPVLPQSSFSIFNLPSHLWNLPNDYFRQSTPEFELPQQPSPIPPGPQDPAVTPTQIPRRLENSPTSATRLRFLDAAPYLWLLGALGYLTVVLAQHRKLSLWLKSQRPLTHHRVVSMIEDVARSLHLRRTPRAYETNCLPAPSLFGFWKPRLLLPKALLENLSDAEFRLIVLHELIHAKRRDVLLNWVTIAVQSLHWFNPFVWLAMSRLRAARELACDAAVMSHLAAEDRQVYGATLIKLVAAFSKPALTPTLIPVINRKKQMHRRITMIANFKPTPRLVTVASAVVLFAIACLTFTRAAEKPVTAPPGAAGKQSLQADASKDAAASKRRIDALEMAFAERDESVRKQEQRLDEMKQKFGISQTDDSANGGSSVDPEVLRKMETIRIEAQADYTQMQALLNQLTNLSRVDLKRTILTASPDALLSSLFAQQTTAEQKLAELSVKLGSENPELLISKALVDRIDRQINDRIDGILSGLKTKAGALRARMAQLQDQLDKAKWFDVQTSIARRPYFQAKRDLEMMQMIRERLYQRLVQEQVDAKIPKQQ